MKPLDSLVLMGVDWRLAGDARIFSRLEKLVGRAYELLYPHVDEIVVLATCNRFEVYMVPGVSECSICAEKIRSLLASAGYEGEVATLKGVEAARHLLRVASGLESMVLGEPEILGQVKRAYEYAARHAYTGKLLDLVFRYAIRTGKRVRSETGLGRGSVGIPGAAVILAERLLSGLEGRVVGVIGAGEAGSIIASNAAKKGAARILVANRTYERAVELARRVERVEPVPWDRLERLFVESDVVFAAVTVEEPIVPRSLLEKARRGLLVIDVSNTPVFEEVPDWIEYHGFEEVVKVAREFAEARRSEVPKAEAIIEEELAKLERVVKKKMADDAIEAMMRFARAMVDREVSRAVSVLRGRGVEVEKVQDVLADLAWSSVRKSLRPLVVALHEAAEKGRLKMLKEVKEYFDREYAKVVLERDD